MFAKTAVASLAAIAALGFAAVTHAAPVADRSSDSDATSVNVSIAGLDLSNPAGAKVVLQRIRAAAQTVCGGEPDIRLTERFTLYQSCLKTTVDGAVASLASPLVTAMNAGPSPVMVADRR